MSMVRQETFVIPTHELYEVKDGRIDPDSVVNRYAKDWVSSFERDGYDVMKTTLERDLYFYHPNYENIILRVYLVPKHVPLPKLGVLMEDL